MEIKNISPAEAVKNMGTGWNIGNSLDACRLGGLESETSWENPPITKTLIDSVCASGFRTIRIPVTWFNHFIDDDNTVDPAWMDRVNEVVSWAYGNGVTVILNSHHENWFYTSEDNYPRASKVLIRLWEQICARFESYGERLLFESLNEPRKFGTEIEWTGGDPEARAVVNKLNADFVKVVRSSGGNNLLRNLIIATYCGCCTDDVMRELEIPDDDKIIVNVHSYKPWFFAAENNGSVTFDPENPEDVRELNETFGYMKKYCTDKGQPLIIDEFGTVDRNNLPCRLAHLRYFKKKAAEIGAKYIWWDNGFADSFALFDRKTGEPIQPEIIAELVR